MKFPKYDGDTTWYIIRDSVPTPKAKMAATKPEVLKFQLLDKIATPFHQQNPLFLESNISMNLLRILHVVTGS